MKCLPLVACSLVLVGCGGGDGDVASRVGNGQPVLPDTQTVDGVLVMRHDAGAFDRAPRWALDSAPEVVIDGGAEFDLNGSYPPELLFDGRAVVLHYIGGGELMLFDSAGKPSRLLARKGHGPGELWAPAGVTVLAGDTLLVLDDANRSINWYTADSGLVRSSRLEATWDYGCFRPTGQLADGSLVAMGYCTSNVMNRDGTLRGTTPLVTYPVDRSTVDTLALAAGVEMRMSEIRQGDRSFSVPRPVELGRFGTVTAIDSTVVLATGENGYALEFLSSMGTTTGRVVVDLQPVLVSDSLKEAAIATKIAALAERTGGEGRAISMDEERRQIREAAYADTLPPYARVMSGGNGVFWVVDYTIAGDSSWSATAFRRDGVIMGRLESPPGTGFPVLFTADRVVLRQTDEDGVVRYGVWGVRRPNGER